MNEPYEGSYRQRIDRAEAERENLRSQRMAALQEALYVVRTQEADALSNEEADVLREAQRVVDDLRRTW